jgi:hypothetical protein
MRRSTAAASSAAISPAPDCDGTKSHVPRKLDPEMPEATNALHGDQISTAQTGVAKGVVGCNARAEERNGICGSEFVRNGCDGARFSDHDFRISSIRRYSRDHRVLTIHHVPAAAWLAHAVFSGNEADTDPLADFPFGYSLPNASMRPTTSCPGTRGRLRPG